MFCFEWSTLLSQMMIPSYSIIGFSFLTIFWVGNISTASNTSSSIALSSTCDCNIPFLIAVRLTRVGFSLTSDKSFSPFALYVSKSLYTCYCWVLYCYAFPSHLLLYYWTKEVFFSGASINNSISLEYSQPVMFPN